MAKQKYEIEHSGFRYDVQKVVDTMMSENIKLPEAVRYHNPNIPESSMNAIGVKIRNSPYFLAYKKAKTEILNAAGPALQANMLDLALNAKSEMVKFSATDAALKRVYGADADEKPIQPGIVFNFSFGGQQVPAAAQVVKEFIDVEPID